MMIAVDAVTQIRFINRKKKLYINLFIINFKLYVNLFICKFMYLNFIYLNFIYLNFYT